MVCRVQSTPYRPAWYRCECCRHGAVSPVPLPPGYRVSCAAPRHPPGRGGIGRACCDFVREPGTDDEVERLPPMEFY